MRVYDKIIIGAGLYGLYSACLCAKKGQNVLVLECDMLPFKRATYINQARVHQGYHYPRSLSTALKSAGYFRRFFEEYNFCINSRFEQIYATSKRFSWTNAEQFKQFCEAAEIPCEEVHPGRFFKDDLCDGAFLTREYTYDARMLCEYFLGELEKMPGAMIKCGVLIESIEKQDECFIIRLDSGELFKTGFLLNATYASTNQISRMVGVDGFQIKYELCEIILCEVNEQMEKYGVTVMDGPFFSIMPFGKTGYHSLTSVTFTPHSTSYDSVPTFQCQSKSKGYCSTGHLGNCNECDVRPNTAFPYMERMAKKFLKDDYTFSYKKSLFSMKPILMSSEIDDSRPTVVRVHSQKPTYVSVLSGKINTVYDLDEVLLSE